jgi:hypothetical protein
MAFEREIQGALLIDGAWQAADIRQTSPIQISRGGMDEQRRPVPSKCTLVLNNLERVYSPLNPQSINYQKLGINTPLLIRVLLARDEFTGTSSSSWGSAESCGIRDTAYDWTNVGGSATDFNEASGSATQLISAANSFRYSKLDDVRYADYGVLAECTVAVNDVTGGAIEPANILLRGSGTNYLMVRVSISTAEVLTVALMDQASNVLVAAATVTGVVDAVSSKTISVRAECEGEILRVRVWKTGQPEPGTWHIAEEDRTYLSAGWPAIRSGVATGNTNVPVTFSYSRVEVYSMRFAGEVAKWPQSRSTDGVDRTVSITAWDMFQRLRQGKSPLKSALRRGITGQAHLPVAYWPCEDGRDATVVGSASAAGPMSAVGEPDFGASDDFPCSQDCVVLSGASLTGTVPVYTATGQSQVRMLVSVPAAGDTNGVTLLRARMAAPATADVWDVVYGTGGTLTLIVYSPAGAVLYNSGAVAFTLNGRPLRLSLEFTQDGADIDWALSVIDLNGAAGGTSGTLAGTTFNRVSHVGIGGDATFTAVAVGHITVEDVVNGVGALLAELIAYTGERAQARILRQAQAEGITAYVGEGPVGGIEMGPQRPLKLLEVFEECTEADLGGLATCRGEVAMRYDRLNYSYNRTVDVSLDLAGHQATQARPEFDNFLLRNKVTIRRIDGSEYTATQTTGRLAAVDVLDGGVGVYDDDPGTDGVNVRYDTQLPDVAHYRLLQGTIDQPRFPELTIDLATPEVRADETLTRQLIDANLWQRWQIANADAEDLYDTVDLFSVGYEETLNRLTHRFEVNAYPNDSHRVFELDSDTYGRLDSDTTTLNEALDTTETGVEVAIGDGVLWTTDAADCPFDIMIGGERMTVTAVSGASSPQTFTVTRNVNGLPGGKSHSVGDEVHLADPVYLAGW